MAEERISDSHLVERSVIVTQESILSGATDFSFRKYAWKQFKKNKPAYISFWILIVLTIISILAPIIANERPLYMKYKGQTFYPAFSFSNKYEITDPKNGQKEELQLDITNWKILDPESVVWAPIPWSPTTIDDNNRNFVGPSDPQKFVERNGEAIYMPSRFKHLLGTNYNGQDVLAGIIHGGRISLSIGFISMGIAAFLGLLLGALAGYFGNKGYSVPRGRFWMVIFGIPLAYFYAFGRRLFVLKDAMSESGYNFLFQLIISILIFTAVIWICSFIGKLISKGKFLSKIVTVPVDSFISRSIEILNSIPTLILILSLSTLVKEPSIVYVMVIIGLTSWTGIARFTRAEFLKIRSLEYIQAAEAMGFKEKRIIIRHALINGMAPAMVAIAFGIAGAILVESALSFLHLGVPDNIVTWGKLLSEGKEKFSAWWLIVFPGLAIFLVVTVYNLIGEGLRDALDPKLKK